MISSDSLTALINAYENNTEILNFFKNFENLARKEEYLILDESSMREIPVASDIKTEGLGILRNASYAARYDKVSTKTDECIFDYICKKYKIWIFEYTFYKIASDAILKQNSISQAIWLIQDVSRRYYNQGIRWGT